MQSLKETKISLGKGKLYNVSPKAKFSVQGFCPYCNSTVRLGAKHQCLNCGTRIKRKTTNEALIDKFEKSLQENKISLYSWIFSTPETEQPKIKIKIGFYTYFIPIRYLLEFENLRFTNDENPYDSFLKHIEITCPRIAF